LVLQTSPLPRGYRALAGLPNRRLSLQMVDAEGLLPATASQ